MTELRLLLVTDAVGGVWVYSLELARALRRLGIEAVLAVMGPSPSESQRQEASDFKLLDTGLPLEWLDTDEEELARAASMLARLALIEQVDLVQTSSAALLATGAFDQPCIAVQHSCVASWWAAVKGAPLAPEFEWRRALVERGIKRAAAVVAPSAAFADETRRIYGVDTVAVHNGRSSSWSREIPQGQFVFTAGRLWDEGKNIATLDCAASQVKIPFAAAGAVEGPNGAHIRLRHIDAIGSLNRTRLSALYAARPIYASAALYEPFGLSVLEAAQAGCALVLSDIGTHREIWNGAAVFVPPSDASGFADAIQGLFADPDERERLGRIAAVRAAHYTPARMALGMAQIYAQVSNRSRERVQMAGAA